MKHHINQILHQGQ